MKLKIFACLFLFCSIFASVHGAYVVKNGKLFNKKYIATMPVEKHFEAGLKALEEKNWNHLAVQMQIVAVNFPKSNFVVDALYYLGVAHYHLKNYDFAGDVFTQYLKTESTPRNFEEVWKYKLAIAEKFKEGSKKHMFGSSKLPKWISGKDDAIEIYDEIIATLPHHDFAGQALLSKGEILASKKKFADSVDTFQALIQRFHRRSFAADGYLALAKLYHKQCKSEVNHPDILIAAKINLEKFRLDFPGDERVSEVEGLFGKMVEEKAHGLYDLGQFYEKIKKPKAAVICYHKACSEFPGTEASKLCTKRLNALKEFSKELGFNHVEETSNTI